MMSATRSGLPLAGSWTVTATQTAVDDGCPTGQVYTWSGSGTDVKGSLPFGAWDITVTDGLGTSLPQPLTVGSSDGLQTLAVSL
jgi:hypothetical protein